MSELTVGFMRVSYFCVTVNAGRKKDEFDDILMVVGVHI